MKLTAMIQKSENLIFFYSVFNSIHQFVIMAKSDVFLRMNNFPHVQRESRLL